MKTTEEEIILLADLHLALAYSLESDGNMEQCYVQAIQAADLYKQVGHIKYLECVTLKGNALLKLRRYREAQAAFDDCHFLNEQLCKAAGGNNQYKHWLALSWQRRGLAYVQLQAMEKALHCYGQSLALSEELYNTDPSRMTYRNAYAIAHTKLGEVYAMLGQREKAVPLFLQHYKIAAALAAENKDIADFTNSLAVVCSRLGEVYADAGDQMNALRYYNEMIHHYHALNQRYPEQQEYRENLGIAYEQLSVFYSKLENRTLAVENLEEMLRITEELYTLFPTDVRFREGLAITRRRLGDSYLAAHRHKDAFKQFVRSYRLLKELKAAFPGDYDIINMLAIAYGRLEVCYRAGQRWEEALKAGLRFYKLERKLVKAWPDIVAYTLQLANACAELGDLYNLQEKDDQALRYLGEAMILRQQLYEGDKQHAENKHYYGIASAKLGRQYYKSGHVELAITCYRLHAQLSQELATEFPAQLRYRHSWAIASYSLGEVALAERCFQDALKAFDHCITLEKVLAADSQNLDYQEWQGKAYSLASQTYAEMGEHNKAFTSAQQYFTIAAALLMAGSANLEYMQHYVQALLQLGAAYVAVDDSSMARILLQKALNQSDMYITRYPASSFFRRVGQLAGTALTQLDK